MATAVVEVKEEVGGLRPGQLMSGTELSEIREAVATTSIRTAVVTITVTVVGVVVAVRVIAMQVEVITITVVTTTTATTVAATPTMGKGGTGTAQGAAAIRMISTTRRSIKTLASKRKGINAALHCTALHSEISVLEDAICLDTQ